MSSNESNDSSSIGLQQKYVTKLEKESGGGENVVFRYNYCDKVFKGYYSRVSGYGVQPYVKVVDEYIF